MTRDNLFNLLEKRNVTLKPVMDWAQHHVVQIKTTKISWTDKTWNPTTGCSRVSSGCDNCYAEALSLRKGWSKKPWTAANALENLVLHPDRLKKPYSWKKPSRVFVNSMSDLFHPKIPKKFVDQVFEVMNDLPQHTFQILTKRPRRAASYRGEWAENVWMGTSIENQATLYRIDQIRECPTKTRFLSFEPLLESLGEIDLDGIHWVIVGGESGKGFRKMDHEWAREIRDQCVERNIPFFFKQSAAFRTEEGTALIETDGSKKVWNNFPLATSATSARHLAEQVPIAASTDRTREKPHIYCFHCRQPTKHVEFPCDLKEYAADWLMYVCGLCGLKAYARKDFGNNRREIS